MAHFSLHVLTLGGSGSTVQMVGMGLAQDLFNRTKNKMVQSLTPDLMAWFSKAQLSPCCSTWIALPAKCICKAIQVKINLPPK